MRPRISWKGWKSPRSHPSRGVLAQFLVPDDHTGMRETQPPPPLTAKADARDPGFVGTNCILASKRRQYTCLPLNPSYSRSSLVNFNQNKALFDQNQFMRSNSWV